MLFYTFTGAEEASFRDVCDIIKASFYRNKIPENEWPNFLQEGIQFPKNFDEVKIHNILMIIQCTETKLLLQLKKIRHRPGNDPNHVSNVQTLFNIF